MRVVLANDTHFHTGSEAVSESIIATLNLQGHEVWSVPKPEVPSRHFSYDAYDALVVNGEGTFRDYGVDGETPYINELFQVMNDAAMRGKRVHFINTVWCNMKGNWTPYLSRLTEVAVREPLSAAEMIRTQNFRPNVYLDASYFAPLSDEKTFDLEGAKVVGKIYPHNFPDRLTEDHPVFRGWRTVGLSRDGYTWSNVVNSLVGAQVYVTGQHHGVYAACLARTPFVYCKCNTHKVEGLLAWACVELPVVRRAADVQEAVAWALAHKRVYQKLFDFMDDQEPWPGIREE